MNLVSNPHLIEIESELNRYYKIPRVEVFNICINNRLASTLRRYNAEIDATSDFLIKQESVRVLKALTKIKKNEDREIIKQNMDMEDEE